MTGRGRTSQDLYYTLVFQLYLVRIGAKGPPLTPPGKARIGGPFTPPEKVFGGFWKTRDI